MNSNYQILNWDEAVATIEEIQDMGTRRFIRRAASVAFNLFLTVPEKQRSDFDISFFVFVLNNTLRSKEIIIKELNGEKCPDWWDDDG